MILREERMEERVGVWLYPKFPPLAVIIHIYPPPPPPPPLPTLHMSATASRNTPRSEINIRHNFRNKHYRYWQQEEAKYSDASRVIKSLP